MTKVENIIDIITSIVVLDNLLMNGQKIILTLLKLNMLGKVDLGHAASNNYSKSAKQVRDDYK